MNDVLLFIDTETSGLPKKWNEPYAKAGNWPYAIQVAWLVYTKEGQLLKQQNHYVNNDDIHLSASAQKIHHISLAFLKECGKDRKKVLQLLSDDLVRYQPLVVGHFMELDYHILGVEYHRAGMDNPLKGLPAFCTMLATQHLVRNPATKYLRLNDLHELLFSTTPEQQHQALADATATAACFFELVKRGQIDEATIAHQQEQPFGPPVRSQQREHRLFFFIVFILIVLIVYVIWKADWIF